MEDAARLLQLVVNGAAAGCIYGLIALGFVLIYKATEMINFAQGDIMMLGGFVAFSLIAHFGLNYWIGALLAIMIIAAFGFALDAIMLRRVIGQPQFAVVMLTLGLGFIFRAVCRHHLGLRFRSASRHRSPTRRLNIGGLVLGQDNVSIIVGTVLLCGVLYVFFSRTRLGIAMQASSQNQLGRLLHGHPGAHGVLADLGDQRRRRGGGGHPAVAGVDDRREHGLSRHQGFRRGGARRFRQHPRRAGRRRRSSASSNSWPATSCLPASRRSRPTSCCWRR